MTRKQKNIYPNILKLLIICIAGLILLCIPTKLSFADEVTLSSGNYLATPWDADGAQTKMYYRTSGKAIVNEHNGLVTRTSNAIQHGTLDTLGRATWAAGYITPTLWAKEAAEDRESATLPDPAGWGHNQQVTINLYDGKNPYNGYLFNRSHLVADSLGGDPIRENLVTGTRTQNVGANDGTGGMAYTETIARNYMTAHPDATLYYSATPVYIGSELVPRSVYVDMKSDDGIIDSHVEIYNTARGYYINYSNGSWGVGDPNLTRSSTTNTPTNNTINTPKTFSDVTASTSHSEDISWLTSNQISSGYPDGSFRPLIGVSRCDMAAFLYRIAKKWGAANDSQLSYQPTTFLDVDSSTPHASEICWLSSNNISTGWVTSSGSYFKPYDLVTRQDMGAFMFRLSKLTGKRGAANWENSYSFTGKFEDMPYSTDNHYKEVEWLAVKGISKGWKTSRNTYVFQGLLPTARCDMAAFLHRLDDESITAPEPALLPDPPQETTTPTPVNPPVSQDPTPVIVPDVPNAGNDQNQSTNTTIVYITKTGKKYHASGCRYLNGSAYEISLEDAIKQGKTACSFCNPNQI